MFLAPHCRIVAGITGGRRRAVAAVMRYGHVQVTNCRRSAAVRSPYSTPQSNAGKLPRVLGPHLGARTWLSWVKGYSSRRTPSIRTITNSEFGIPATRLATALHYVGNLISDFYVGLGLSAQQYFNHSR